MINVINIRVLDVTPKNYFKIKNTVKWGRNYVVRTGRQANKEMQIKPFLGQLNSFFAVLIQLSHNKTLDTFSMA